MSQDKTQDIQESVDPITEASEKVRAFAESLGYLIVAYPSFTPNGTSWSITAEAALVPIPEEDNAPEQPSDEATGDSEDK